MYWNEIFRSDNDIDKVKKYCNGGYHKETDNSRTTVFVAACEYGCVEIAKWLLANGAKADDRYKEYDWQYDKDETPLMRACVYGELEIVKLLLENGAKINYQIYRDRNIHNNAKDYLQSNHCLTSAIRGYSYWFEDKKPSEVARRLNIIKYLIECGANVGCVSEKDVLIGWNWDDSKSALVAKEMLVYVKSYAKQIVILKNVKSGNLENIKKCLANGMNVNDIYAFSKNSSNVCLSKRKL